MHQSLLLLMMVKVDTYVLVPHRLQQIVQFLLNFNCSIFTLMVVEGCKLKGIKTI